MSDKIEGPHGFALWQAHLTHQPSKMWMEYLLYSDSRIPGEIMEGLGPFQVFSALPDVQGLGIAAPALCLRINYPDREWYKSEAGMKEETDDSYYHGRGLSEEIAALISLILGGRLKSGPETRLCFGNGDPKGRPTHVEAWKKPLLAPVFQRRPALPNVYKETTLVSETPFVDLLKSYPRIKPDAAIALVRSARLYQDAIWIAETDPSTAWLFLVSAIETAAHTWRTKSQKSVTLFRTYYPELTKQIVEGGGEDLLKAVAAEFAGFSKVKDKFISFSLHFMPDAPPNRPEHPCWLVDWEKESLTETLEKIYKYRSNALHSGIPFPFFMNDSPDSFDGKLTEVPAGLGGRALGGVWNIKDMPIFLNSYEYMVRNVLLKWWATLPKDAGHRSEIA